MSYQRVSTSAKAEPLIDSEFKAYEEESQGPSFGRLFSVAAPERCLLLWATFALVISSLSNLVIPTFIGLIMDSINRNINLGPSAQEEAIRELNRYIIMLGIIIAIGSFFSFIRGYWFNLAGERVVARIRKQLFSSIIGQEIGMFDLTRTGELVNRLSADTSTLKNAATINISMALRWLGTVIGGLFFLFKISWKLSLIMLSVVPVVLIGARAYGSLIRDVSKKNGDANAKATEVSEESFSNIRTVKSFSNESYQSALYGERVEETFRLGAKLALLYGLFLGVMGFVGFGAVILVIWFGARMVIHGEISPGTLTAFLLYTITIAGAMAGLSEVYSSFSQALGASARVFQLIDRVSKIPVSGGLILEKEPKGQVKFVSVSFSYPSRPEVRILKDLDLAFEPGKVVSSQHLAPLIGLFRQPLLVPAEEENQPSFH